MSYLSHFDFYRACYTVDLSLYQRFKTTISPAIVDARNNVNEVLGTDITSEYFCRVAREIISDLSIDGITDPYIVSQFLQHGIVCFNDVVVAASAIAQEIGEPCTKEMVMEVAKQIFDENGREVNAFC